MSDRQINILIVGNGFGGVYALKNLHKEFKKNNNIKLSMIGERNYFLFTPLLHEVATGGLVPSNIVEPIRKVLGCYLHKFYMGKADLVDLDKRSVTVNGKSVPYDYLVLAPGAATNFYNTPGAERYAFSLKNLDDAIRIKNHLLGQMEKASHETDPEERKKMLRFVVVGGGPTGVELVTEMEELVRESFSRYYPCEMKDVSLVLVQRGKELVPQFHPKIRAKTLKVLRKKGIELMLDSSVLEVGSSWVKMNDGLSLSTETVIWVAGIKPNDVNINRHIEKTLDGRIVVNGSLQIPGRSEVFVIGDMAALKDEKTGRYIPALAQVAEKESETVARNIRLTLEEKPLEEFRYRSTGNLLSLGQWMAAAEIKGFVFSGHFAWWLWRTVYLAKFISWRKKIRVAVDWTMNLFSPRDISEL